MTSWLLGFLVAQSLDLGTTCAALQCGWVEGNPLWAQHRCLGLSAVKVGAVSGEFAIARSFHNAHPRFERLMLVAGIATGATGAIWNARQLRRRS